MKKLLLLSILCLALQTGRASVLDSLRYEVRLGYALGGTAPVGMPAEIRSLSKYTLRPNWTFGVAAERNLSRQWGVYMAVNVENKDMKINAKVKNYKMEMTRGSETLAGRFTGNVETNVRQWMITIPVMATFQPLERLRLRLGPYVSILLNKEFTGFAYDGHLRVDDPTGALVLLGTKPSDRGSYDFSHDMRHVQLGADLGADYRIGRKWGVFFDLSWGLTGVHHSSFHTMEQTLYPIYGTLGLVYRFNKRQK